MDTLGSMIVGATTIIAANLGSHAIWEAIQKKKAKSKLLFEKLRKSQERIKKAAGNGDGELQG